MASITDLRAYSTLLTDNLPRFLARDSSNKIYIDSGTQVGTLSGISQGAFMIPYRPNASPQAWMYVGAQEDYRKYSAPDIITDAVTEALCGIEEQQEAPDACPNFFAFTDFFAFAAAWVPGGTAALSSNTVRLTDTAVIVLKDPASGASYDSRCSVEVSNTKKYQIGMNITVGAAALVSTVQDILPAVNQGIAISVRGIYYFSGTTGHCVIVPTQGPVATPFQSSGTPPPSIYAENPLSSIRRGSIVKLTGAAGNEKLFVLSSTVGPDGTICFEVTTTLAFVAGDSITGLPAISLSNVTTANTGSSLDCRDVTFAMTGAGIGAQSVPLFTSPFNVISAAGGQTTQQYDYIGFGIQISDLANLVYVKFIFNVDPVLNYNTNTFTATFLVSDFAKKTGPLDLLPSNEYAQFMFPISSLERLGTDLSKTLSDTNAIQVQIQTTGSVSVRMGPFYVGVGNQPDVGPTGSPLFYAVRTRSSLTGAASNPSPVTRYGVGPRRQSVRLTMQDSNTDSQDDLWDIYRMGGSVNTMRYIGTTLNTGGIDVFVDNYFDTAALGGSLIEYDNFQPWPTIDQPFTVQWGGGGGITITIAVVGTIVLLVYSSAIAFTDPTPDTILRWLPGTLITINGLNAYTLWDRPKLVTLATPPAAHYYAYRFRLVENAGVLNPTILQVNEPNVANQPLPYLWGPDAEGTVFGCGDPLRPGTVYFCKSFNPDSAPDSFNQEITNPSEPLMGGEVINGLALVASTKRWWALYPNFGSGVRYQAVEAPVKRGLVAPYARCTDGQVVYFWGKDGIWTTQGQSLTDADLHNIFPHEGVDGIDYVYGGKTVYAPDYKYASLFRLCYKSNYLYADYRDSEGLPRTLVCDLRDPSNPAWCVDEYADPIGVHYAVEQQAGTLLDDSDTYISLVMGDDNGVVHVQRDRINDNGTPITGVVATQEFNGGDIRSNSLFNDQFLDLIPAARAGVVGTIMEGGVAAQAAVTIASSVLRVHTNIRIGLELNYMGVLLEWIDDFDFQSIATLLRSWQPMLQSVPVSLFLWKNQGTAFGTEGYKHIRQIIFAYKSTAPVTLTITVYDGTSPVPIVLPSTSGAYRKTLFTPTFNKGMLFFITMESADTEWQPYLGDSEFYVGPWERGGPYGVIRDIATAIGVGEE